LAKAAGGSSAAANLEATPQSGSRKAVRVAKTENRYDARLRPAGGGGGGGGVGTLSILNKLYFGSEKGSGKSALRLGTRVNNEMGAAEKGLVHRR